MPNGLVRWIRTAWAESPGAVLGWGVVVCVLVVGVLVDA